MMRRYTEEKFSSVIVTRQVTPANKVTFCYKWATARVRSAELVGLLLTGLRRRQATLIAEDWVWVVQEFSMTMTPSHQVLWVEKMSLLTGFSQDKLPAC